MRWVPEGRPSFEFRATEDRLPGRSKSCSDSACSIGGAGEPMIATEQRVSIQLPNHRAYRLEAIDILRGLVILIMAIDHVRDFFLMGTEQDPMANPNITLGLFATRWITHFCAPVFMLLAGASA